MASEKTAARLSDELGWRVRYIPDVPGTPYYVEGIEGGGWAADAAGVRRLVELDHQKDQD